MKSIITILLFMFFTSGALEGDDLKITYLSSETRAGLRGEEYKFLRFNVENKSANSIILSVMEDFPVTGETLVTDISYILRYKGRLWSLFGTGGMHGVSTPLDPGKSIVMFVLGKPIWDFHNSDHEFSIMIGKYLSEPFQLPKDHGQIDK